MADECLARRIERPSGLCGYRPTNWCAVCGRKITRETAKQCEGVNCPNLCHTHCLGEATDYKCGNTGHLRATAGIYDAVTFYCKNTQATPDPASLTNYEYDEVNEGEDDLNDLERGELLSLVRNLRRDLASKKAHLSNYRLVTSELADKRQIFVEALGIIDTLLATHACEDVYQHTVACTAIPHKIDGMDVTAAPMDNNTEEEHSASLPPSYPPYTRPDSPPLQDGVNRECISPTPAPTSMLHPRAQPQSTPESGEESDCSETRGEDVNDSPMVESDSESDSEQHPRYTPQEQVRIPQQTDRGNAAVRTNSNSAVAVSSTTKQPRQGENALFYPRAAAHPTRQLRCPRCRRSGHTRDRCPRISCEYCQGRAHTSLNCRVKMADRKQQELVEAMRRSSQETVSALRSVFWQLQQPASIQAPVRSYQGVPWGSPLIPQTFWPSSPPPPTFQYPPGMFPPGQV